MIQLQVSRFRDHLLERPGWDCHFQTESQFAEMQRNQLQMDKTLWIFMVYDIYGCLMMFMDSNFAYGYAYSYHNYRKHMKTLENYRLVGGLEHFLFFHILGIMIPTD